MSGDIDVFSPEEVWALVRAAGDVRDTAIYITAAFTGLRMGELRALKCAMSTFRGRRSGSAPATPPKT
jgi:integrase